MINKTKMTQHKKLPDIETICLEWYRDGRHLRGHNNFSSGGKPDHNIHI